MADPMNDDERKSVIVETLVEVYGDTSFTRDVSEWLADRLMDEYDNGVEYSWGIHFPRRQEFVNLIWMNFPGGTTADYAATKIIDALGLTFDRENVRYDDSL